MDRVAGRVFWLVSYFSSKRECQKKKNQAEHGQRAEKEETHYSTTNIPMAVMEANVIRYQLRGASLYLAIRRQ